MHYTPNGKPQQDRSSVGLIFAKEPPKHRVLTKPVIAGFMRICTHPGRRRQLQGRVATTPSSEDAHILSFMPHMHLRGKDFHYEAIYPDGKTEIAAVGAALRLQLAERSTASTKPLPLPKGTKIALRRPLRQLGEEPEQPRPDARRSSGATRPGKR